MASRKLFDPLVILRTAPLITSTCSLWFAWDQHFFLKLFLQPEHREQSRKILPSYFEAFFRRGVISVLSLLTLTISTTIANLYIERSALQSRHSFRWYIAGAALTTSHLLFVPFIAPTVQSIIEDQSGSNTDNALQEWLHVNTIRGLTVDLAAWVTLGVAVARTLRV